MYQKKFKFLTSLLISVFLTLGLSISLQSLLAAWQPPGSDPPISNINPPVYNEHSTPGTNVLIDKPLGVNKNLSMTGSNANIALNGNWITRSGTDAQGIYIDTNGNLGIGSGNIRLSDSWISNNDEDKGIRIRDDGNVGIGISNPGAKLEINGDLKFTETDSDGLYFSEVTADNDNAVNLRLTLRDDNSDSERFSIYTDYWNGTASDRDVHYFTAAGNAYHYGNLDVGGNIKLAGGNAINEFSTDATLSGNSDSAVPTEKAVKAYVDAAGGGGLKVYKSDGVTVLGDFMQMENVKEDVCESGTIYSDGGNLHKIIDGVDCVIENINFSYYSDDCTGTPIVNKVINAEHLSYNDYHYWHMGKIYKLVNPTTGNSAWVHSRKSGITGTCQYINNYNDRCGYFNGNNYYTQCFRFQLDTPVCGEGDCIIK